MPGHDGLPQLVCFDLGGVVIRIASGWKEAAKRAGVRLPPNAADVIASPEMMRLTEKLETGRIGHSAFDRSMAALSGLSAAEVAAIHTAWLLEPYEGVAPILEWLRRHGIATACLSNTSARHWELIHGHGRVALPMRLFDHTFASHLIGTMKPSAAIYSHVERTTAAAPGRILFFDDNEANIAAASRRGWQAHLIAPPAPPASQMQRTLEPWVG